MRPIRVCREYFSSGTDASVSQPKEFCTADASNASNALLKSKKTSTSIASAANLLSSTKTKKSSNWRSTVFKTPNGSFMNKKVMMEQLPYSDQSVSPIPFDVEHQNMMGRSQQLSLRQELEVSPESRHSIIVKEKQIISIKGEQQQVDVEGLTTPLARQPYIRTIKVVEQDSLSLPGEKEAKIIIIPRPKQIASTERHAVEQKEVVLGTRLPGKSIITPKLKKASNSKQPMNGPKTDPITETTPKGEKDIALSAEIEKKFPSLMRGEKVVSKQITEKSEEKKIVKEQDNAPKKKEIKSIEQKGKVKKMNLQLYEAEAKLVVAPINKETYVRTIEAVVRNEILSREEISKEEAIDSSSKIISTVKKTVVTDPAKEIKLNSEIGTIFIPISEFNEVSLQDLSQLSSLL